MPTRTLKVCVVEYFHGDEDSFEDPKLFDMDTSECDVIGYAGAFVGARAHARATLRPNPVSKLAEQGVMFIHVANSVAELRGPAASFSQASAKTVLPTATAPRVASAQHHPVKATSKSF